MDGSTLLSIKEFSQFSGVTQSTLRYYDSIGLLSPISRGENNYRYYAPSQIMMVKYLKILTDLNVPLSDINEIRKTRAPERTLNMLIRQEGELDNRLQELQTAYSIIHTIRDNIKAGVLVRDDDMDIRLLEETRVILGGINDYGGMKSFYKPFVKFCNSADENRINLSYPVGGYFDNVDAFLAAPSQPARFFSQDPRGNHKRKGGRYLIVYTRGFYGEMGDLPQRLIAYAQTHDFLFDGPLYVTYLLEEISMPDPNQYLAQAMVRVSEHRPV